MYLIEPVEKVNHEKFSFHLKSTSYQENLHLMYVENNMPKSFDRLFSNDRTLNLKKSKLNF
jgi:hypothetical protein